MSGQTASRTNVGGAGQEPAAGADGAAIRPSSVDVPEEELTELRRRVLATRRPERETVADPPR